MRTLTSGPITTGEDAFTRSPDCPGLVLKRVLVHLQLCDLGATQVGRYRVNDDLTKAETDHQSNLWRLFCGERLVRVNAQRASR
jgi:hypothetical protein